MSTRIIGALFASLFLASCWALGQGDGMNLETAKEQMTTTLDETVAAVASDIETDPTYVREAPCDDAFGGPSDDEFFADYTIDFEQPDDSASRALFERTRRYWEEKGMDVEVSQGGTDVPSLLANQDEFRYRLSLDFVTRRGVYAGSTGCRSR